MELPKRKKPRLQQYDYSSDGAYFVTICIKDKQNLLGSIVGGGACDAPQMQLSAYGVIVRKYIDVMNGKYDHVRIEKYVVMPNHVHMLVVIEHDERSNGASQAPHPTDAVLPKFISLFKRYCNREIGHNISSSVLTMIISSETRQSVKRSGTISTQTLPNGNGTIFARNRKSRGSGCDMQPEPHLFMCIYRKPSLSLSKKLRRF